MKEGLELKGLEWGSVRRAASATQAPAFPSAGSGPQLQESAQNPNKWVEHSKKNDGRYYLLSIHCAVNRGLSHPIHPDGDPKG